MSLCLTREPQAKTGTGTVSTRRKSGKVGAKGAPKTRRGDTSTDKGYRRNACYGKPCGDRLAGQVPGSPSLSTTVTRWPGNSSLAAFRASCLSAAKTGVTAIPSGRSAITSNSKLTGCRSSHGGIQGLCSASGANDQPNSEEQWFTLPHRWQHGLTP
jgi:hypothetical protein